MSEDELKNLSMGELLKLAVKVLAEYVIAVKANKLTDQHKNDLKLLHKIIAEKPAAIRA